MTTETSSEVSAEISSKVSAEGGLANLTCVVHCLHVNTFMQLAKTWMPVVTVSRRVGDSMVDVYQTKQVSWSIADPEWEERVMIPFHHPISEEDELLFEVNDMWRRTLGSGRIKVRNHIATIESTRFVTQIRSEDGTLLGGLRLSIIYPDVGTKTVTSNTSTVIVSSSNGGIRAKLSDMADLYNVYNFVKDFGGWILSGACWIIQVCSNHHHHHHWSNDH